MRWSLACLIGISTLVVSQESTDGSITVTSAPATSTESGAAASSTEASSTSSAPITHTIGVAKGGHTFEPDVTLAKIGDTVKFEFYPTNHSVVRAEYGYPCIPYEYTGVDKIGFYSGFKPVDAVLDDPPAFYVKINDTNPIFFYCGATGSCINWQMVGVINPNATTSLQYQKQLAKDSSFMLTPGQPWPDEAEDPFTTTTAPSGTATSTGSNTSGNAAAATTDAAAASSSHHSALSAGAIAGIAIGAAAVALAAAVLLYICGRQSRRQTPVTQHEERPGTGHATVHSMAYNPHGHPANQYMDPAKHMSMHSSVMPLSPALPGYAPSYDHTMSPSLHHNYPMSDSLKPGPGSDIATLHSTSPSPLYSTPAYPTGVPPNMSSLPYGAPLQPQIHEMAGSDAAAPQGQPGAGIAGYMRRSSISKSQGVERYT